MHAPGRGRIAGVMHDEDKYETEVRYEAFVTMEGTAG